MDHAVIETNMGAIVCCWRALTWGVSDQRLGETGLVTVVGHQNPNFKNLAFLANLVVTHGSFKLGAAAAQFE